MDRMRRQVLRQMASLATLAGASAVGSSCANAVFAASESESGPLTVVEVGRYRRGRTGALPKIIRTPAQLVADKLVIPYDRNSVLTKERRNAYRYKPGDFGDVGLASYMGGTGERQEIGVETDATADWLMGGSPNNMLAQAEAHGSVPVHFIAPDGRIVDAVKYRTGNSYSASKGSPFFSASGGGIEPEYAHYPSLCYVAYLATGDQYYLEELQFAATFQIISRPPDYRGFAKPIIDDGQIRGLAWGLREVAKAYVATPDQVSGILLPKSYWKGVVDNLRVYFEQRIAGTRKATYHRGASASLGTLERAIHQFHSYGASEGLFAPWQNDYLCQVLGWMIWTGRFPEWQPVYDFFIKGQIMRATGPLRSQAIHYWMEPKGATDWPSLLAANGRGKPTDDHHFPSWVRKEVAHYPGLLRMALGLAVKNGVAGAKEAYDYAHAESRRIGLISVRHAV